MIKEIQKEHAAWQERNFGPPSTTDSLIGISEELGELSHAFLKNKQGIRLNEDHEANMEDAVGDLLIYLISFCTSKGYDLEEILKKTWDHVKQRDWVKYPNNGKFD